LRGATARQVQALRFVEVGRWFPCQWDPRASEGFYTPLHEDFYRAYIDSGIAFRPQRVCRLESLVEVVGEQLHPHLYFLRLVRLSGMDWSLLRHLGQRVLLFSLD
jgi:hypothetical protein